MTEITEQAPDRVIVVGLNLGKDNDFDYHMEELEALCEACDYLVVGKVIQALPKPHNALYIGTGKVQEVKELAAELEADVVIFDNALSPSQVRNLNQELGLPVLDRTSLILQIFATRAQTREAQLQVELAQYQYLLPRLAGLGAAMSRQRGTSGSQSSRGAGEKKIELDRRRIEQRITELSRGLEEVKKQRQVQRKSRALSQIPQVALVGYTNAGKSTILNQLLLAYGNRDVDDVMQKTVFEKDMLFATLDTTVRKLTPEGRPPIYVSDTVGFIDKLPHHLVDAFRSTLEEACAADLLLQVVDYSDLHYKEHMRVTADTLAGLGAGDIPMITVYNKADLVIAADKYNKPNPIASDSIDDSDITVLEIPEIHSLPLVSTNSIHMAAKLGIGLEELLDMIYTQLFGRKELLHLLLPYAEGGLYNRLTQEADVHTTEYRADGIYVEAELPTQGSLYHACKTYIMV